MGYDQMLNDECFINKSINTLKSHHIWPLIIMVRASKITTVVAFNILFLIIPRSLKIIDIFQRDLYRSICDVDWPRIK